MATLINQTDQKPWHQWVSTGTNSTTLTLPQTYFWTGTGTGSTTPLTWGNTATTTTSSIMTVTADDTWYRWQGLQSEFQGLGEDIQANADRYQVQREEASRRRLAAQQVLAVAQDRAMGLLLSLLTEEEAAHHLRYDEIKVRSEHGNLYVIEKRGVHGNITLTDEHGCRLGRICVAPRMYDEQGRYLPSADGWLGQYLMLKHDEDLIISRGNWSMRRPCQHPGVPILGQETVAA